MIRLPVLMFLLSSVFAHPYTLPLYESDVASLSRQFDGNEPCPCNEDERAARVTRGMADYPTDLGAMLSTIRAAETRNARSTNYVKPVRSQTFVISQPIEPSNVEAMYLQSGPDEVKMARSVVDVRQLGYSGDETESARAVRSAYAKSFENSVRASQIFYVDPSFQMEQLRDMRSEARNSRAVEHVDPTSQGEPLRGMRSTPFIQMPFASQSYEDGEAGRIARAIGIPVQVGPMETRSDAQNERENLDSDGSSNGDRIPKPSLRGEEQKPTDEPKQPHMFAFYYVKTRSTYPLAAYDDFETGSKNDQKVDSAKDAKSAKPSDDEEKQFAEYAQQMMLKQILAFAQQPQDQWYPQSSTPHAVLPTKPEPARESKLNLEEFKTRILIDQLELEEMSLKESLDQVQGYLKELKRSREPEKIVDPTVPASSTTIPETMTVGSDESATLAPVAFNGDESTASSSA